MQIFIIHNGRQTGPFTEDAVQTLLTKGHVQPSDLGWRKGLAAWAPLSSVIEAANEAVTAPPPVPPPATPHGTGGSSLLESAMTLKQIALLRYLGADIGEDATKETAALAISDALEKPKLQDRIRKWHDEKLRLHPDLFQDEIDQRRATRVNRYLELCQTEGAEVVNDVTKAHVQVLVESLDRRFPRWETDPAAALWDYILPAIIEHFPKLARPDWKGKLTLGGTSKVAAAAVGRQTGRIAGLPSAPSGTLAAAVRGIIYGAVALAIILAGLWVWGRWKSDPSPVTKSETPSAPPVVPVTEPAAKPEVPATVPEKNPVAAIDQPPAPPVIPPAPAPAEPTPAATPVPPPQAPVTPAADNKPPAMDNQPPSPPDPGGNPPPATPAPVGPRTTAVLTQAVSVNLPNGQIRLPSGTRLRILAAEGASLRVVWNNQMFYVPASATDVAKAPAIPPPPPPGAASGLPQPQVPPGAPASPLVPPPVADPNSATTPGKDL